MNIFFVTKIWLIFYYHMYIYCLPLLLCMFWFWLTHVDRVHLRLKFNKFGKNIKTFFKNNFKDNTNNLFDDYMITQINSFGEILAGFTDGFLNKTSSIKIGYTINSHTQTDFEVQKHSKNCYIQTDNIEKADMCISTDEKNETKKLFVTSKKKILDTEIFEKDIEEDLNEKTKIKKRIYMVKK